MPESDNELVVGYSLMRLVSISQVRPGMLHPVIDMSMHTICLQSSWEEKILLGKEWPFQMVSLLMEERQDDQG